MHLKKAEYRQVLGTLFRVNASVSGRCAKEYERYSELKSASQPSLSTNLTKLYLFTSL